MKLSRIAILALLAAATAAGYTYDKWADQPFGPNPAIRVHINESALPDGYHPNYRGAVEGALKFWREGGNQKLNYTPRFELMDGPEYADVEVRWFRELPPGEEFKGEGSKRVAGRFTAGRPARIELEVGSTPGLIWVPHSELDVREVAKHELGHALGLNHSDDPGDVMYYEHIRGSGLMGGPVPAYWDFFVRYAAPVMALFGALVLLNYFTAGRRVAPPPAPPRAPGGGEAPPARPLPFRCSHCGYATIEWAEVELSRCPRCQKRARWLHGPPPPRPPPPPTAA